MLRRLPGARLPTRWTADAWAVTRRSPDGYPDAVTLSPSTDPGAVLSLVDAGPSCSVKDSFAVLDLEPSGFRVLFEATWIRRAWADAASSTILDWHRLRTPADLAQWASGHDLDVFVPGLLADDDLRLYGSGPYTDAGFALSRHGGVVGASTLFARSADLVTVWSDLIAVAAQAHPGLDIVGYELGAGRQAALSVGFAGIGSLRVWMR